MVTGTRAARFGFGGYAINTSYLPALGMSGVNRAVAWPLPALPSWREGLPRSAVEAAASGLPQVLTDIRGCREVVRDGVEGFLVPVRDPVGLAEAIARLLEDSALRRRMGAAARERAEDQFDEDRVARVVVGATRLLLSSSRGKR